MNAFSSLMLAFPLYLAVKGKLAVYIRLASKASQAAETSSTADSSAVDLGTGNTWGTSK